TPSTRGSSTPPRERHAHGATGPATHARNPREPRTPPRSATEGREPLQTQRAPPAPGIEPEGDERRPEPRGPPARPERVEVPVLEVRHVVGRVPQHEPPALRH